MDLLTLVKAAIFTLLTIVSVQVGAVVAEWIHLIALIR
jgi:hypothetical protein